MTEVCPLALAPRCATIGPALVTRQEPQHLPEPGSASALPSAEPGGSHPPPLPWQPRGTRGKALHFGAYPCGAAPRHAGKGAALGTGASFTWAQTGWVSWRRGRRDRSRGPLASETARCASSAFIPPGSCNACGKFHHACENQPMRARAWAWPGGRGGTKWGRGGRRRWEEPFRFQLFSVGVLAEEYPRRSGQGPH